MLNKHEHFILVAAAASSSSSPKLKLTLGFSRSGDESLDEIRGEGARVGRVLENGFG